MKPFFLLILIGSVSLPFAHGAVFTNGASADAFVRASASTSNYGGAGADSVSGAGATNAMGTAKGAFDTFIRFNTFSMVTNFNALFGLNNWVINGASLQVTEQAAPNNAIFNRGKGAFEIRWIANDNWTEGTGNPTTPGTTGIVYTDEPALLNDATDVSCGTFTNAWTDGVETFTLPLASSMVSDMQAGGEVGLYMTAVDANVGFTFGSRSFNPTNGCPFLIVSALPRPGISSANFVGADLNLSCTNGAAGTTYRALVTSDVTLPVTQWTPVATNTLATSGAFGLTISNALTGASTPRFFTLQAQ